ncbi:tRNA epoxyqueuosine(34) reductase QueG [Robbsia sp. KACC 23696]|uniref:tRNA epoxyqueuosine(34) reductase QueG n=1 Tax=Robbsia sp. KACC 23696 TaxID=3149231 RepID=UPI00325A8907
MATMNAMVTAPGSGAENAAGPTTGTGPEGAVRDDTAAARGSVTPVGERGNADARELDASRLAQLASSIKDWARALGFDAVGISDIDLHAAEPGLLAWLAAGYHGQMHYMEKHGLKRARPAELVPGTQRVISVRLPYLPSSLDAGWRETEAGRLDDPEAAVVSVYARGRDYHKVMRQRLQRLADRIAEAIGPFGHRVFTDSAPVMEVELARRAGVGWRGKHTLLLARDAGSFFFLGELYLDVPLPVDRPGSADADAGPDASGLHDMSDMRDPAVASPSADGAHCGGCRRCIDACPTGAIVAPFRLDARRCISYLTIEFDGSIPEAMRPAIGNRIYGCDDCQTVCPWNKFAKRADTPDFDTRNDLDSSRLVTLFHWTESDFDTRLSGSAIRRIGHSRWLRNIAVALGNALRVTSDTAARQRLREALTRHVDHPDPVVREHVAWALVQGAVSTLSLAPAPARS